jgi:hypothetical protein
VKLKKVISGGQSGADKEALKCARALGLETGGTAPRGYRTENGPDLELRDKYGLVESRSSGYTARTDKNVLDADVTLWFGRQDTPGYAATKRAASKYGKPFEENPVGLRLAYLLENHAVWNVAGNRESKNPYVTQLVRTAFGYVALFGKKD